MDGSGKVDGSIVVALPIDRWSAPESTNSFVGHGGVSQYCPDKCCMIIMRQTFVCFRLHPCDALVVDRCSLKLAVLLRYSVLTIIIVSVSIYTFFQGLTFWDGRNRETKAPNEIHYETRSGDLAFIDR